MTPRPASALPTVALLAVTAAWGSTFFLIKDLLLEISVLDFLSVRFLIAAALLVAVAPRSMMRLSGEEVKRGVLLGIVYGVAQLLQTLGLERTSASVSGFVTGMYVVVTPLLVAFLLRERIGKWVWFAVLLSTLGLGFLSLQGLAISPGVALVFASALLYAVHIVGLGHWASTSNAFGLSVLQMIVIAVVCTAASAPNGIATPQTGGGWWSLIYMAVVAGAGALLAQTWAQAHLSSTRAAIIMTMEPVFAAFFAVLFGGEVLTTRMAAGGTLVLAAMFMVELSPKEKSEAEVKQLTASESSGG
ncbi:MAG: DMT family transporter [Nocardioidaceae bacterium]|nr:DMT family transporter [Nocardioidaceae bacterium]